MKLIEVKYIIIHHTGTLNIQKDPTGERVWNNILKNHQKEYKEKFPWSKAPYHYGIGPKGNIFKGEDEDKPCIHSGDDYYNQRSLGVSFIGNFEIEVMTPIQLFEGASLVKELMRKYEIPPERVLRHKDIVQTKCPGKNFPWEKFSKYLLDINSFKQNSIDFALKVGWIKNSHSPDEVVDFGTLLTVLKNFYDFLRSGN